MSSPTRKYGRGSKGQSASQGTVGLHLHPQMLCTLAQYPTVLIATILTDICQNKVVTSITYGKEYENPTFAQNRHWFYANYSLGDKDTYRVVPLRSQCMSLREWRLRLRDVIIKMQRGNQIPRCQESECRSKSLTTIDCSLKMCTSFYNFWTNQRVKVLQKFRGHFEVYRNSRNTYLSFLSCRKYHL